MGTRTFQKRFSKQDKTYAFIVISMVFLLVLFSSTKRRTYRVEFSASFEENKSPKICYFVPLEKDSTLREAYERGWVQGSERVYYVFGDSNIEQSFVKDNDIIVKMNAQDDYQHLSEKMKSLWLFLSKDDSWSSKCNWFAKADMDSWINTKFVELRLSCIDFNIPHYLGQINTIHPWKPETKGRYGLAQGAFYVISSGVIEIMKKNLEQYNGWKSKDGEDTMLGYYLQDKEVYVEPLTTLYQFFLKLSPDSIRDSTSFDCTGWIHSVKVESSEVLYGKVKDSPPHLCWLREQKWFQKSKAYTTIPELCPNLDFVEGYDPEKENQRLREAAINRMKREHAKIMKNVVENSPD